MICIGVRVVVDAMILLPVPLGRYSYCWVIAEEEGVMLTVIYSRGVLGVSDGKLPL